MSNESELQIYSLSTEDYRNGDVVFGVSYGEILRFKANGDILVKGRLAVNDIEVVDAVREYFNLAKGERK